MMKHNGIFKKLFFGFAIFFAFLTQGWGVDSCSVGLTKALTGSSNTYTSSGDSTNSSGKKYYFTTDGPGVVVVSVATANNHLLTYDKAACPTNSGGLLRQIFTIDSSDTDFNVMVYRGVPGGSKNYTLNVVFFPANGDGLKGEYYNNTTWSGTPVLSRTDLNIDVDWGTGSPHANVSNDNFSAIWSGKLYIPETANYTFYAAFDDYMDVTIDGVQKYSHDGWTGGSNNYNSFSGGNLTKGYHLIQIRYREYGGGAYARIAFSNDANILTQTIIPQQLLSTVRAPGYCETNGLTTGFHMINPDGIKAHTFEIFCDDSSPKRDLIALPIKNTYNNFVYKADSLGSKDYYVQARDNSTSFNAIEINANTMEVVVPSTIPPTDKTTYKIMGKGFSNINLIGTPFAIDWSNTTVSNCTTSKLRNAYYGQSVKINTLDYDSKAICSVETMKIKLLSDYQYLEYESAEVLKNSCKDMAEAVPTNILDSSTIKGHYYVSPAGNGRSYSDTDITKAYERPVVSYCWYQEDLKNVWTFFLALDGFPTRTKDDLVNKVDSCSKSGLWPFVPNSEKTFDRVRGFLADRKSEWSGYTGTIEEKVQVINNNTYYLDTERGSTIWPYGSFGVFFPYSGNKDKDGNSKTWSGWMSGSPMHNISSITTDYARKENDSGVATRDYYSWGRYSDTDAVQTDAIYEYKDTMGYKGWVSILGSRGLNKTEDWFISRTGAGQNFDSTGNYPYFEPNGNYTAGAWLNFLYDDEGKVRHNDDWDSNYPYYDYMCMSGDNYNFTSRYSLILQGPFGVIEKNVASGGEASNKKLYTKISASAVDSDVVIFNDTLTAVEPNKSVSAGVFLRDATTDSNGNEVAHDLRYVGQLGTSDISSFPAQASGRFPLKSSGLLTTWMQADKRMFFEFRFCNQTNMLWTDCWTRSGDTASCKSGKSANCLIGNSDDFVVRPATLSVATPSSVFVAGATDNKLTINAKNTSNIDDMGYIQSATNLTPSIDEWLKFDGTTNTATINVKETLKFESGSFVGGISSDSALSFPDVGRFKMYIADSNWATVDKNAGDCIVGSGTNTPDASGKIGCVINSSVVDVRFKPYQFNITDASLTNAQTGFTYFSNDLSATTGVAATIPMTITAVNKNGVSTKNYASGLYEQPITITPTGLTQSEYPTVATTDITQKTLGFTNNGNVTLSSADSNVLKFNFARSTSTALSPLTISGDSTSVAVTDTDSVSGSIVPSGSAVFLYGKVSMPNAMVDYSASGTDIRAFAQVYATSSASLPSGSTWTQAPGSTNWWINSLDSASSLPHVYVRKSDTLALSNEVGSITSPATVVAGTATMSLTPTNVDQKLKIHLDVPPYLWYSSTGVVYDFTAGSDCTKHPCAWVDVFGIAAGVWFGDGKKDDKAIKAVPKGKRKPKVNW